MTQTLKCISPIDGSVFAERPVMAPDIATEAVAKARRAQKDWAKRPLDERIALVKAGGKFFTATKEIKVTLGGCGG